MFGLLWLIPIAPFAGFIILALFGRYLPKRWAALLGCGSVGVSAATTLMLGIQFLYLPIGKTTAFEQTLWTWLSTGGLTAGITLRLDALSLLMAFVITFVGFLIHLYSTQFMADDEGYSKFFAYMNLFVGSMLMLVLANNLLLLYLGWEGVGLCSYLLIGFWYKDPANGRAAMKAFIITRVGDVALAIALFLLFRQFQTLDILTFLAQAPKAWAIGSSAPLVAALLLLGGAVGKSAQLPLQTWLPDAMAGPTPVSALIHAATMVTAGVYLIARMHAVFELAPTAMLVTAVIGAATLLLAACSALAQRDLKRILAYSTISQIGYMFLALGVGAWTAAMFHFLTHAFFKALLFLGAGVVILSQHEEHDIFKMGGLARRLPTTYWTFLIGALSLSAFPLVTAGFWSKDDILTAVWASGHLWLWTVAIMGAFLTAVYSFRMVFTVFHGPEQKAPGWLPGPVMTGPLVVLAFFAVVAGFVNIPSSLGGHPWLAHFLSQALPAVEIPPDARFVMNLVMLGLSGIITLGGIFLAYQLYRRQRAQRLATRPVIDGIRRFWLAGWGFDWLYDRLFVRPFRWLAQVNQDDIVDWLYRGLANLSLWMHNTLSRMQNGNIRWYAVGIALGVVILLAIVVFR